MSTTRALIFGSLGVLLCACAGSPRADGGSPGPTRVVGLSGGEAEIRLQSDVRVVEEAVPAPPAAVWQALPAIYRDLGIPITVVDSAALSIAARSFVVRGQLAGTRLSSYFSCGSNLTGEIADQRRVRIDLVSRVVEASGGAAVLSAAEASARSDTGASADPVVCTSRGTLEQLIGVRARLHIARNWTGSGR